jgi:outer membrane protein assembly factor BamB
MTNVQRFFAACMSAGLLLSLGACSSVSDILSTETDEAVSGDTVAVLALEEALVADPRIADMPINLPRAFTNTQWAQPGGAPTNSMQHLVLEGDLDRVWSRSAGVGNKASTRLTASPVLANGRLFVLDAEAQVFALDAETGARIWRKILHRSGEGRRAGFGGGVAFAENRVIVTTGFGDIYALDEETGEEIWSRDVGVPIRTAATVISGRAFLVTTDNQLLAVDTENGEVLWNQRAFQESAGLIAATSPAATNDVVVAPFTSGELDAVRIQTGSLAWSDQLTRTGNFTPLANINAIAARPVINDGRVYAISHSGRFVAIDLRTGERIWTINVASTQTPWIAGNFAYVVTVDAKLLCISTRDGRVRWLTQMDQWRNERNETGAIQYVGPVLISDRLVVISSQGRMEEYSPFTGEFLDSTRVGDPVSLPPIVANNTLYVYTDDADLVAFRGNGEVRQRPVRQPVNEINAEADATPDDEANEEAAEEDGGRGWLRWPWSSQ